MRAAQKSRNSHVPKAKLTDNGIILQPERSEPPNQRGRAPRKLPGNQLSEKSAPTSPKKAWTFDEARLNLDAPKDQVTGSDIILQPGKSEQPNQRGQAQQKRPGNLLSSKSAPPSTKKAPAFDKARLSLGAPKDQGTDSDIILQPERSEPPNQRGRAHRKRPRNQSSENSAPPSTKKARTFDEARLNLDAPKDPVTDSDILLQPERSEPPNQRGRAQRKRPRNLLSEKSAPPSTKKARTFGKARLNLDAPKDPVTDSDVLLQPERSEQPNQRGRAQQKRPRNQLSENSAPPPTEKVRTFDKSRLNLGAPKDPVTDSDIILQPERSEQPNQRGRAQRKRPGNLLSSKSAPTSPKKAWAFDEARLNLDALKDQVTDGDINLRAAHPADLRSKETQGLIEPETFPLRASTRARTSEIWAKLSNMPGKEKPGAIAKLVEKCLLDPIHSRTLQSLLMANKSFLANFLDSGHKNIVVSYFEKLVKSKRRKDKAKHEECKRFLLSKYSMQNIATIVGVKKGKVQRALNEIPTSSKGKELIEKEIDFIKRVILSDKFSCVVYGSKHVNKIYLTIPLEQAYLEYLVALNDAKQSDAKFSLPERGETTFYERLIQRRRDEDGNLERKVYFHRDIPPLDCGCIQCLDIHLMRDTLLEYQIPIPKKITLLVAQTICGFSMPSRDYSACTPEDKFHSLEGNDFWISSDSVEKTIPKLTTNLLVKHASRACLMRECPTCDFKVVRLWRKLQSLVLQKHELSHVIAMKQWRGRTHKVEVAVRDSLDKAREKSYQRTKKLPKNWDQEGDESKDNSSDSHETDSESPATKIQNIKGPTRRMNLLVSWSDFLAMFCQNGIGEISKHYYMMHKHTDEYNKKLANLEAGQVIITMDFMQNLEFKVQEEAQSAQFHRGHCVCCPFVCYLKCNKPIELPDGEQISCEGTRRIELVFITSFLTKDSHMVQTFNCRAQQILEKEMPKGKGLENLYYFMDNSGGQFKNRFLSYYMSISPYPTTFVYWAERHGKGAADRCGSTLVKDMKGLSKTGKPVASEQDMPAALNHVSEQREHMNYIRNKNSSKTFKNKDGSCIHSCRRVILIKKTEVEKQVQDFEELKADVRPFDQIKKAHMVTNKTGLEGVLRVRETACLCRWVWRQSPINV